MSPTTEAARTLSFSSSVPYYHEDGDRLSFGELKEYGQDIARSDSSKEFVAKFWRRRSNQEISMDLEDLLAELADESAKNRTNGTNNASCISSTLHPDELLIVAEGVRHTAERSSMISLDLDDLFGEEDGADRSDQNHHLNPYGIVSTLNLDELPATTSCSDCECDCGGSEETKTTWGSEPQPGS
ncbi:unnamed protein product [Pseudo-nitzschia multistriata]|uniref:Uncharacterized protein n=1 Tax=Pseudo-nitzschia multistriata TaxID=183589 RepID=A0A448YYS8_9STRA|nr:unnamed protein product [Pseudo-nitzschia multistriata]